MDLQPSISRAERLHAALLERGGLDLPDAKQWAQEAATLKARYPKKPLIWPCDILPAAVVALSKPTTVERTKVAVHFIDRCAQLFRLRNAAKFDPERILLKGYLAQEVAARLPLAVGCKGSSDLFSRIPDCGLKEFEFDHGLLLNQLANAVCMEIGDQLRKRRIACLCDHCTALRFFSKDWGRFCSATCRVNASRKKIPSTKVGLDGAEIHLQGLHRIDLDDDVKGIFFDLPHGMTLTVTDTVDSLVIHQTGEPSGLLDERGEQKAERVTIFTRKHGWKVGTYGVSSLVNYPVPIQ